MASMRDVLVNLSSSSVTGQHSARNTRTSTVRMLANVKTFVQDAGYDGKTLIGNITGSTGTFGST